MVYFLKYMIYLLPMKTIFGLDEFLLHYSRTAEDYIFLNPQLQRVLIVS